MAFRDLDTLELKQYICGERSTDAFWYFMHIPKTAGSSFSEAMQKNLSPYKNIQIDYENRSISHNEKISLAVRDFLSEFPVQGYRSASGHTPFDLVQEIRQVIPNVKVVTFLRDPVSRVVSDFRYQRTEQHPPYQEFIRKFPTLEDYVESKESQNKVARFVAGRGANFVTDDLIERIDLDFSFVGTLEMYPLSYNLIFYLFGIPAQFPKIHARKTPDIAETKVSVTKDVKQRILDTNKFDVAIYSHVTDRLLRVREAWADYTKFGFPEEWS